MNDIASVEWVWQVCMCICKCVGVCVLGVVSECVNVWLVHISEYWWSGEV